METTRQNKVARLIQKELSDIFQRQTHANVKQIRFELGARTRHQLRIIPELKFFVDDSLDYAENIDKLLND